MDGNGTPPPIRVLVADDSIIMRSALARMLKHDPLVQLCGFAVHGRDAVEKARLLRPDVITLDILMPEMDGLAALQKIMSEHPCPIIIVSSVAHRDAEISLEALSLGAFHYISKEDLFHADSPLKVRHVLLDPIEAAARSPLCPRREQFRTPAALPLVPHQNSKNSDREHSASEIVAIGSSTGGPKVLEEILTALPGDLPVPILVVQHMAPGFIEPLATRLNGLCELRVHEARPGEILRPATVYVAPANKQMSIFSNTRFSRCLCLADSPETLHKPSVDVLMLSVAETFGERAMGVILTGMGSDGLRGMTAIYEEGGITIGQDEATSAVYGMPKACAESGVLQKSLPPTEIAKEIRSQCFAPNPAQRACGMQRAAKTSSP